MSYFSTMLAHIFVGQILCLMLMHFIMWELSLLINSLVRFPLFVKSHSLAEIRFLLPLRCVQCPCLSPT